MSADDLHTSGCSWQSSTDVLLANVVRRARSLQRCSSTTSCAGSSAPYPTTTAPWHLPGAPPGLEAFEPERCKRAFPSNLAQRYCGTKRSTSEELADVACKRFKESTVHIDASQGVDCGSYASVPEVFVLDGALHPGTKPAFASSLSAFELLEDTSAQLDEPSCCIDSLSSYTASEGCHFDLPGLLDDFTGGGLELFPSPLPVPSAAAAPSAAGHQLPLTPAVDPVFGTKGGLKDVLRNLRKIELGVTPLDDYLGNLAVEGYQAGEFVDQHMRRVAVSWLVEVTGEFRLHQETLFLTITLLDRYLSATQAIPRCHLQLVCVTCMFLAAKHEEESIPTKEEFTSIADNCFEPLDLLRMESVVLDKLEFRLNRPTAYDFLQLYNQGCRVLPATSALASYVLELTLLDYTFVKHKHRASAVAASVLAYCQYHQGDMSSVQLLEELGGWTIEDLQPCIMDVAALHHHACCTTDGNDPVIPVKDKYKHSSQHFASKLPPAAVPAWRV